MSTLHTTPLILKLDSPDATLELAGGKGASLARLAAAGLPVPPGFHITTHAYRRFVNENQIADAILSAAAQAHADDPSTLEQASAQIQSLIGQVPIPADIATLIRQRYGELGADDPPVAVRSSATAEDLPEMSFAGQQETYLNVRGGDKLLDGIKRCWASLWTARAIGYRLRHGISPEDVSLAVVVQQLVPADVAGILFTANPLTGARDQMMMMNAAWGLGEAIVGGHVTPDTFIVNKQTGALSSQDIADNEVMTVLALEGPAGGTREAAVPAAKRKQATLQPPQVAELARLGAQIEQLYGRPMDIEWAMHNDRIYIVQARPITALPEPRPALDWKLPQAKASYWRSSVVELLPDPLSPLFATLALPFWNDAYANLARSIGFERILSDQMLVTINDYAYYEVSIRASQALWLIPALPRLRVVPGWLDQAQVRWAQEARPRYAAVIAEWDGRELSTTSATPLLAGVGEIVKVAADHYLTIQSGILPVSYLSESLFTSVYNCFIKRKDDPTALTFMLGFDSTPIQAEKSLYDLAMWARSQQALADYLASTTNEEIMAAYHSSPMPITHGDSWREFGRRFGEHLNRFGHSIYDLDFAKSLAADDPAPLLETLKYFLAGQARNPYERQAAAAAAREQATQMQLARLKGVRLRWFKGLVNWAQRYAPLREDALADVGLGWPLLRRMLREVGRRLVAADAIVERDDIFWLKRDELETAATSLDRSQPTADYRRLVAERRAIWVREQTVIPPVTLPIKGGGRFLGINFSGLMPAHTGQTAGDTIKGIGASPGQATGVARVIHGPDEFNQMQPGDILVAKITTPAWTPLFALAAGVVTDVGGPLSHSSIVAREYHIPAVLGTGVATERIRSGQPITVDGDSGEVAI
jgi:pyruvate,water dikinase